ncbi:MAG: GTPase Era [Desulfocapsaceae bacterium]|nr:GTPase Era [Desulfocapsaceae bacterium]
MDNIHDAHEARSGMIAIVGPPNAGKSTLLNCLLGQKISIVTPKPQTTRNRILGVLNGSNYQIVFIDTPGLHTPDQPLNREMVKIAMDSFRDVDAVLFLLDTKKIVSRKKAETAGPEKYLAKVAVPTFLLMNKIDLVSKEELLPLIAEYAKVYPFHGVMPISAKKNEGIDVIVEEIVKILPVGPKYFPEDIPTDATERFLVGEIIREKVFLLTGQEIPYSTAVVVDNFNELHNMITIHASIILERNSQKGIVIGKGAHKLKSIGIAARKDIERMVGTKVNLNLLVKVKKNWSQSSAFLKELGF